MGEVVQGPDWRLVNPHAAWQARDSQGELVFDGQMWLLGGWFDPKQPNPRDVWRSPDGRQWTCAVECAPWEHSDLSAAMAFRDRMWFMGGRKLPGAENSNRVWSSPDGAHWTLVTADPGWGPRVSMSYAVWRDRMWLMGGSDSFYEDTDQTLHDDVWSTADGRAWELVTPHAGWPARTHAQAVVFQDRLWLLGGGRWCPETVPRHDVWVTDDGEHWTAVTSAAPWAPRIWFAAAVYRDCLWLLGGWSREHGNFGDVWFTRDGRDWHELRSALCWSARHEPSALVFQDQLWLLGGYAERLSNEVWSLALPADWTGAGLTRVGDDLLAGSTSE